MASRRRRSAAWTGWGIGAALIAACGPAATPSAAPLTLPPAPSDPAISLQAPAEATAGSTFAVGWTGQETSGDFFVIVPAGSTTWTETPESPYYNATMGNPITLTAPKTAGDYEVWFVKGNLGTTLIIKARTPLKVT